MRRLGKGSVVSTKAPLLLFVPLIGSIRLRCDCRRGRLRRLADPSPLAGRGW